VRLAVQWGDRIVRVDNHSLKNVPLARIMHPVPGTGTGGAGGVPPTSS
jgi:hypothetical protein